MVIKSQSELEKNIKLEYITFNEITCKHCKTFLINSDSKKMLMVLDHFFQSVGKQKINSFYRCPAHHLETKKQELKRNLTDEEKKQALQSGHVQLLAVDLGTRDPRQLYTKAAAFGEWNGLGLYPWGIHLDLKPRRAFWVSSGGKYQYFNSPIAVLSV